MCPAIDAPLLRVQDISRALKLDFLSVIVLVELEGGRDILKKLEGLPKKRGEWGHEVPKRRGLDEGLDPRYASKKKEDSL